MTVFSVVLPVYNGETYLADSIRSVLSQTLEDFELVVVDDASKDGSVAVVSSFSDSRIRLIERPVNGGLFSALNEGITASRGELVKLWTQDDAMEPTCLAEFRHVFTRHPEIGMAYCSAVSVDATGNPREAPGRDDTPELVPPALALAIMSLHGCITANISTTCIPRRTVSEVGPFDERLVVSGDFEFWVRVAERMPIGRIRSPLVRVRSHARQLSRLEGSGVRFIRENRGIFARLMELLSDDDRRRATIWARRHRHPLYVHQAVRDAVRGRTRDAREILSVVRDEGGLFQACARWAITGNGRWLRPRLPE